MGLKNKVAIVTGASSGIGRTIAQKFLEEGAFVVFSDIKKEKNVISKKYIGQSDFMKCDFSKSIQVKSLVNKTLKKYKRLDIVVDNVEIFSGSNVTEESDNVWNKVLNVNLNGVFHGTR